ncbi:MAG: relaxase/mobilization nuclease domain-containing protein [Hyphomicrobiaceae bacterium]|nr:relaxase/mobilization nuclease domain-containing protein [Hyphomicrobiaceae bacterium]
MAADYMSATAELSRRCTNPAYHVMIAWHEREQPTTEVMQTIARQTLELSGLGAHEALVVGHGDKRHRHLHMLINRVHPDTGKAWSTKHDYRRFDAIMRKLSDDHDFDYVPAHTFSPEETEDLPKNPGSKAVYAAKRGATTERVQWSQQQSRRFAERISEQLDQAASWDDLETAFADHGLALEAKGKGYVVGDKSSYTKLSRLGLVRTAKGFSRRRVAPSRKFKVNRPLVDTVDIARGLAALGLASHDAVRDAVNAAHAERMVWLARKPLIEQLLAGLGAQFASWTSLKRPRSEPLQRKGGEARRQRRLSSKSGR